MIKLNSLYRISLLAGILFLAACGGGGGGTGNGTDEEDANVSPTTPAPSSPQNLSTCSVLNPVMQWAKAYDQDGDKLTYSLFVGTEKGASDVFSIKNLSETKYTIPSGKLEISTKYFWYVSVSDGTNAAVESENWSFSTKGDASENHVPSSPQLLSPTNNQQVNGDVKLMWKASDGDDETVSYTVYLELQSPPHDVADQTEESELQLELVAGTWFWQVKASDESGNSSLSNIGTFTVL